MRKKHISAALLACAMLMATPFLAQALSGADVDDIKIKVETKQGGDWFDAIRKETTDRGVLKIKDVLPGWYRFSRPREDTRSGQALAVELRMLDNDGRRINEKTDIDLSMMMGDNEVEIGKLEIDEDGWIKIEGLNFDTEYKMDISDKDDASLSHKDGKARVKVKAKIDDSDWFPSYYDRTDENYVLEIDRVLPGKYKFKYKTGDRDPNLPFTLDITMLDERGNDLDEPTAFNLYTYINKIRVPIGTVVTDDEGRLLLPGIMHGGKYKIELVD